MFSGVMLNNEGFTTNGVYMEQEEEWEREGLLDPAWEKQQKKVKNTEVSTKWSTGLATHSCFWWPLK